MSSFVNTVDANGMKNCPKRQRKIVYHFVTIQLNFTASPFTVFSSSTLVIAYAHSQNETKRSRTVKRNKIKNKRITILIVQTRITKRPAPEPIIVNLVGKGISPFSFFASFLFLSLFLLRKRIKVNVTYCAEPPERWNASDLKEKKKKEKEKKKKKKKPRTRGVREDSRQERRFVIGAFLKRRIM